MAQNEPLRLGPPPKFVTPGKGFDGHEAQPVAGGLVAVDDPTECKLAYLAVVSHPECPWWAKLRRAESLIDVIRHASRRSTEQGVAGRLFGRR